MTQDNKPRDYHFGTDIPIPTWEEVEAARSQNDPNEGMGLATMMVLSMVLWAVIGLGFFLWFVL